MAGGTRSGKRAINYKLRDWLFSRQRYWGEPFPVVWEPSGWTKHRSLDENELPVVPPPLEDYKPTGTGEPPLAKAKDWVRYSDKATRETNVMPQWAGSCWYYLRFCDPQNDERFVGEEAERYWMSGRTSRSAVDLYVGGTEHAVLHLLYARFWHKVLFDLGYVSTPEPFQRLVNQGIILGEDNRKMSKSRGNIVNPDDVIERLRRRRVSLLRNVHGPARANETVEHARRRRRVAISRAGLAIDDGRKPGRRMGIVGSAFKTIDPDKGQTKDSPRHDQESHRRHRVTFFQHRDFADDGFRERVYECRNDSRFGDADISGAYSIRSRRIITSELWEKLMSLENALGEITTQTWPEYDETILVEDEVEIVVQINGKVRDRMKMPIAATKTK